MPAIKVTFITKTYILDWLLQGVDGSFMSDPVN